jgi:hypothetical protein
MDSVPGADGQRPGAISPQREGCLSQKPTTTRDQRLGTFSPAQDSRVVGWLLLEPGGHERDHPRLARHAVVPRVHLVNLRCADAGGLKPGLPSQPPSRGRPRAWLTRRPSMMSPAMRTRISLEVPLKPIRSQRCHLLQRARFFEEVGGAGHDLEALLTGKHRQRLPVEFDHLSIVASDDE